MISRSVFFVYSRLQHDAILLGKAATMVIWAIAGITVPIALAVFIVAPDLLLVLYGGRWVPAAPFLRLLIVYAVLRPLWDNGVTFFIAVGKPKLTARCTILQTMVLIVCGIPLTLQWGAIGACVAVGLSFITGAVYLYGHMARQISINLISLLGGPALAGLLTMVCYLIIIRATPLSETSGLLSMALKGLSVIGIFFAFTLILQPSLTRQRFQQVIRLLTDRAPS